MSQVARHFRTVARVMRTRYPPFVFGLPLARGEIPIFTYHDVEPERFSRDLEYLRDNGYRTIGLEEYLSARSSRRTLHRSVLLTFDDARKSFSTVALPLLAAFDCRAVLFAPTYWMKRPSQAGDDLFMSWPQVRDCVASGRVDVQSHAHRHALVFTSAHLEDFATQRALDRFDIYDWPMRHVHGQDLLGRAPLGYPICRAAPLLSAGRRYLESEAVASACCDYVDRHGGAGFFEDPHACELLRNIHSAYSQRAPGRFMSADRFRRLMASEFEEARAAFVRELGYAPTSIAYPWMIGSEQSLEFARRVGLRAAFGVALDFGAQRRGTKLPLPVYGRLKSDWLRSLPGVHRTSILVALRRKIAARAQLQHLAH